jgi:APA family basic amino acid/polyamine antiporter
MPADQSSKNKLGLWTSTSLVIGNMVGAGVFLLPAALASFGAISLVGWVVSSLGALFLAKILSNLSKLLPDGNGGPYAYTRKGFGDFAGFIVAWGYWISCWCTNATIAVSLISALSIFFPVLATNSIAAVLTGLSAIWFLTWLNTRGIKESGNMQLITTILKLIPLVLVAVVGLFFIRWENFTPFNMSGTSSLTAITATATLTFFAYLGIECATIPSGNVENPEKTIPRATMIGTLITMAIYILGTISVMGIIPAHALQTSVTPFADAAVKIFGNSSRYWVGAGVAIAAFGALNGWILITGQISMAIAKDKLFPAVFKRENKKGVPAAGVIIASVLVSVCMIMNFTKGLVDQFTFLSLLTTMTVLVAYFFSAASYLVLVIKQGKPTTKTWMFKLLPAILAFLFSIWAMIGTGKTVIIWGSVLLLAGLPFYGWIKYKKNKR